MEQEKVVPEIAIVLSADRAWYCVPGIEREGALWLGVEEYPMPVPPQLHHPGMAGAVIMRGRSYWRRFTIAPMRQGEQKSIPVSDPMVADYRDACWWAPGLEGAWAEADGFKAALDTASDVAEAEREAVEPERKSRRARKAEDN